MQRRADSRKGGGTCCGVWACRQRAWRRGQKHCSCNCTRKLQTPSPNALTRGSSPPTYSANQAPKGRGLAGWSRGPLCSRWCALLLPAPLSSVLPCHLRHSEAAASAHSLCGQGSVCGGTACSLAELCTTQGERWTVGSRYHAAAGQVLCPPTALSDSRPLAGCCPGRRTRSRVFGRGATWPPAPAGPTACRCRQGWAHNGCHRRACPAPAQVLCLQVAGSTPHRPGQHPPAAGHLGPAPTC